MKGGKIMVNSDKKFLFFVVYSIVLLFTIYFSYTFISSYIQQKREYELFKQSWQYVADTNFETEVEIDPETNEERVINLISTPEQLAGAFLQSSSVQAYDIGSMTNKKTYNRYGTYKLTCNVNLSGKTWTSNDFYGTLYGGSFVISNLSMSKNQENLGFVSKLTGTIKDVFFDNIFVNNTDSSGGAYRTGGVAGYVNGGKIENVSVVSGKIWGNSWNNQNNDRCVGGIAGYMDRGTIKNCKNAASLHYGKFIGGIVGKMNGGTTTNCINYANIEDNNGNTYPRYGGICGESYGTITLCMNRGNVKCNISTEWESEVNGVKITFYGDIKVGGIVGDANTYAVTKCANYGDVSGGKTSNRTAYVGGIAGMIHDINVEDCYNSGSIYAYAKEFSNINKREITTISSSDTVKFKSGAGLFWAYTLYIVSGKYTESNGSGEYRNKTYASYLSETGYLAYRGGIVGYAYDGSGEIKNCFNKGYVSNEYSEMKTVGELYFKWKANGEFHLLIKENFSYGKYFNYGVICGNNVKMTGTYEKSYSSSSLYLTPLSLSQTLYNHDGKHERVTSLNSWISSESTGNDQWYLDWCPCGGNSYHTTHGVDASDRTKIVFSAKYENDDKKTYYIYETGITGSRWTSANNGIYGNIPTKDSSVWNSDYTLKDLYW